MVRQSQATLLLTRPQAQSARFAQDLGLPAVISPLMEPEFLLPPPPDGAFEAVVLTSETGAEAARRISAAGHVLPNAAFCVGQRTARMAARAGFTAVAVAATSADLSALICAARPLGRLLILRPEESAGDIEKTLLSAGIETVSQVTYRQKALPLSAEAARVLTGRDPVIAPLFSPRTARIFAGECRRIQATAPLFCVAISAATAAAFDFPTQKLLISLRPDGAAMGDAVSETHLLCLGS